MERNKVTLWHITVPEAWKIHKHRGEIVCLEDHVWEAFKKPYSWMTKQMQERLGMGRPYPVWAWYQYASTKQAKPDLRCSAHVEKGAPGIRLTLWMYRDEVLLSDFDLWHYPLNNVYLGKDKRIEKAVDDCGWRERPQVLQREVEKSWDNIFNLKRPANRSIQATMWSVPIERVTKVEHFTGR